MLVSIFSQSSTLTDIVPVLGFISYYQRFLAQFIQDILRSMHIPTGCIEALSQINVLLASYQCMHSRSPPSSISKRLPGSVMKICLVVSRSSRARNAFGEVGLRNAFVHRYVSKLLDLFTGGG